jgi:DNA-binding LacI/PurR family transcriptional regulator
VAVTIYDVAAEAGVSISTVSHVLNRPTRVSASTRERVLQVIDEVGFVPRAEAFARARKGMGRVGVVVPLTSYVSFEVRLRGAIAALRSEPFELVVFDQESLAVRENYLASLPLANRLDGLVVMALPFDDVVAERLVNRELPTVLMGFSRAGFSSVGVDDTLGGRLAAEHLLGTGHRRVAVVSEAKVSDRLGGQAADRRVEGIRAALAESGVDLPAEYVSYGAYGVESARNQALALLRLPERPTAIVAHSDIQAVGVLQAAQIEGLAVPESVAVIGFDNLDIAEYLGLTTIAQPLVDSGRIAVETLLERIANPVAAVRQVTLPLELIKRRTA